jgi:hypothetical protein
MRHIAVNVGHRFIGAMTFSSGSSGTVVSQSLACGYMIHPWSYGRHRNPRGRSVSCGAVLMRERTVMAGRSIRRSRCSNHGLRGGREG